jgi:ribonuclease III
MFHYNKKPHKVAERMNENGYRDLERRLAYVFEDRTILDEACRHSSYVNEQNSPDMRDNERLEFLGDAVLNLVVGHILMIRFPGADEGDLSRMRAGLVNESQLAGIATAIDLGRHIRLGKGEIRTNGREKTSILANTLEALVAAVYLDGGYDAVYGVIRSHFSTVLDAVLRAETNLDYKSKLQELVQTDQKKMPVYRVVRESGPDHDKTFGVRLEVCGLLAEGTGKSKKLAEQDAARKILDILADSKANEQV